MRIVNKSILESDAKYICHQCNCLTSHSAGLAKSMFDAFPYANIYATRENLSNWKDHRDQPGTINIAGNGKDKRFIINMFAQIFPGKPKFPYSSTDGWGAREGYFKTCLDKIALLDIGSIAFPDHIGCSMAGGNWENYLKMIEDFDDLKIAEVYLFNYQK